MTNTLANQASGNHTLTLTECHFHDALLTTQLWRDHGMDQSLQSWQKKMHCSFKLFLMALFLE